MKKIKNHTNWMLKEYSNILIEEPSNVPVDPINPKPLPMEVQNLSLDMKVDSYFMKYEKESLPTNKSYSIPGTDLGFPQEGFKKTFLKLLEADDMSGGLTSGALDVGGADPLADPTGEPGEEGQAPTPQVPPPPDVENPRLNISNFAQGLARLIMNYENLLDPKTTILNRAKAYIEKNYDAGIAKSMMEILERQFQLSPRENQEVNSSHDAPLAAGSWAGVGGGGGG